MSLTSSGLKAELVYFPYSGIFYRRSSGEKAGGLTPKGYLTISIRNRRYRANRLAALYITGRWPKGLVDHINRDKADNRWNNLRDTGKSTNAQNVDKARRSSTTGLLGVLHNKKANRFLAQIAIPKKTIYLGCYKTPEEAHLAYLFAKRIYHVDQD